MFRNLFSAALLLPATAAHAQSFDPAREALRQFDAYKPKIEASENASVDTPNPIVGDLNGDGRPDCLLYFVLTPKDGGNMIVGQRTAVYLNTGKGMKVDGQFPELKSCYVPEAITNGLIRVGSYECAPPYNTKIGTQYYRWQAHRLVSVKR